MWRRDWILVRSPFWFEEDILTFRYRAIGLPDLSADAYREQANPLAPALSALMKPGRLGLLAEKYRSMQQTLLSSVDEARKSLLLNLIETYMPLNAEQEAEFAQLLGQEEAQEVRRMITVYEERGIAKGITQGKREMLLHQMRLKFGELPEPILTKVEAIATETELDALSERILTANSLEEMGLLAS
jgi:hypothetical protein